jgi:hypothetical protein
MRDDIASPAPSYGPCRPACAETGPSTRITFSSAALRHQPKPRHTRKPASQDRFGAARLATHVNSHWIGGYEYLRGRRLAGLVEGDLPFFGLAGKDETKQAANAIAYGIRAVDVPLTRDDATVAVRR